MILLAISNSKSNVTLVFGPSIAMRRLYLGTDPYDPSSAAGLVYLHEKNVCFMGFRLAK